MSTDTKSKKSVLIVDDQTNWREILTTILENGYRVYTANTFEDAQSAINSLEFNVAVLDIRLEDLSTFNVDGLVLVRMLKEKQPRTAVIILTGYSEGVRPQILEEYNIDAFLSKAWFDRIEFKALIERLIGA